MVSAKRPSSLLNRRPAHIGITIDEDGIRYVKYNSKQGIVERAGLLPVDAELNEDGVPDVSGFTDMVKRWVNRRGLAGKKVRLAAPTSQSFIRLLSVPKVKRRQQRRVTELEIEGSIRLPFEDPVIDYHWMEDREQEEALLTFVAAVPRPVIQELVSSLEQAGLRLEAVDLAAIALSRILRQQRLLGESGNVMAINFKAKEAEIYTYHHGLPDFVRTFPLEPMTGDKLNTWRYGEIVSSVTRMMNFYEYTLHEGNERVQSIVIAGAAPDKPEIARQLTAAFDQVSVSEVDLSPYFAGHEMADQGSYAIALGLAMKGADLR
ncbi:type IV pilus biogenesis protein PilM [Paenibacillus phocaensis]|uniref:type IV pilus biogenesis protein PilM n=1 Tax=Paenibacillus phocaensis TaxID=1776378 RepID=UPI000839CD2E|nr:pilus assembly protein PilM [Paenibacillus phocaensis]